MSQTREALESFIRWVMRDTTYHKHYSATVQGQVGDELDVLPDDTTIRANGLSRVPIMYGLPGVSATVAPGTRVTLYFEDGEPSKPRVANWQGGHIELSFAGGTAPVARVGDNASVDPTGLIAPSGGGPVTGACLATIIAGAPTVKS